MLDSNVLRKSEPLFAKIFKYLDLTTIIVQSIDTMEYLPAFEPMNIAIFNNGVPSMSLTTDNDRSEILRGIEGDVLDNNFPPDAEEANELEAAEEFVWKMANLEILEDREEKARTGFYHLKKRWEVRRAAGPSGRPRPAMHLIVPANHSKIVQSHKSQSIVPNSHRMSSSRYGQTRSLDVKMEKWKRKQAKNAGTYQHRIPIYQPRKVS